jgi:hypothetical protein
MFLQTMTVRLRNHCVSDILMDFDIPKNAERGVQMSPTLDLQHASRGTQVTPQGIQDILLPTAGLGTTELCSSSLQRPNQLTNRLLRTLQDNQN